MPYHRGVGYQSGSDTSLLAADSMVADRKRLREAVLKCLYRRPMTPDECARSLGLSVLSIRPRFTELLRDGLIVKTDERRLNISGRSAVVHRLKSRQIEFDF